jgi:hypothetical protein
MMMVRPRKEINVTIPVLPTQLQNQHLQIHKNKNIIIIKEKSSPRQTARLTLLVRTSH